MGVVTPVPEQASRSASFRTDIALLREAILGYAWNGLIDRPPRLIFRRPPSELRTPGERMLLGVVNFVQRMLLPVLVTTFTASWPDAPVWTWIGIAAVSAAYNTWLAAMASESYLEELMAMPAAIERDSGVRDLVTFAQRWFRLRVTIPIALAIAVIVLGAVAMFAPVEFRAMHIGSVAMAGYFLYEYGEMVAMRITIMTLFIRESRHPHRLSWFDPLNTSCIQTMITSARRTQLTGSIAVVTAFIFSIALIGPQSFTAMLAPIAGLSIVLFATDTISVLGVHRSVRRIAAHSREATLERLRRRIDSFEDRVEDLTPAASQHLRDLIATYSLVREAATAPRGTFGHVMTTLAIPAGAFFLAVMAEVYAERLINQVIP